MKLKAHEISTRMAENELLTIRNYAHYAGDKALDISLSDFIFDDENRNRLHDMEEAIKSVSLSIKVLKEMFSAFDEIEVSRYE